MELPAAWRFLGSMWWVLHVIAIGLVFFLGYVIGKASAEEAPRKDEWPAEKEGKK